MSKSERADKSSSSYLNAQSTTGSKSSKEARAALRDKAKKQAEASEKTDKPKEGTDDS